MSMSDYAIEQEEESYQDYGDFEIDYLQEMEDEHFKKTVEDDALIDNLVDEWLENQAVKKDENLFWEDM